MRSREHSVARARPRAVRYSAAWRPATAASPSRSRSSWRSRSRFASRTSSGSGGTCSSTTRRRRGDVRRGGPGAGSRARGRIRALWYQPPGLVYALGVDVPGPAGRGCSSPRLAAGARLDGELRARVLRGATALLGARGPRGGGRLRAARRPRLRDVRAAAAHVDARGGPRGPVGPARRRGAGHAGASRSARERRWGSPRCSDRRCCPSPPSPRGSSAGSPRSSLPSSPAWRCPSRPVTLGNWQRGHEIVLVSTNGGINFFIGNDERYDATLAIRPGEHWKALEDEPDRAGVTEPGARSAWFYQQGRSFWREHPARAASLYLRKLYLFFDGPEIPRDTDLYADAPGLGAPAHPRQPRPALAARRPAGAAGARGRGRCAGAIGGGSCRRTRSWRRRRSSSRRSS